MGFQKVFADNGPQFIANEYKQFAKSWDFDHNDTSSPHFPQSNGLAERTVQTVKQTLKKAHKSGQDIHLALLALNTTPSRDGLSPAFKMFNRHPCTTLPSAVLNSHHCIAKDPKPKEHHDKRAKDLPELQPGTVVRMRIDTDKSWKETGKIVEKCEQPHSYFVMNSKGNIVRRNRRHLLPTAEKFQIHPNYDTLPTCLSETTQEQSVQPTSVKPALSIVFACKRFHEYIYGREIIIQNDHKPLKTIFSRSITSCPPRIQRFFLRLQKYSFTFEYAPGKTMKVADTLSRAYISKGSKSEIDEADMTHYVHSVMQHLPVSDTMLKRLQSETAKDQILQILKEYTIKGWPSKPNIDPSVMSYYQHRDDIVYNYDLLLKGQRIIIPTSMRSEIKTKIHQGHQGQDKCILRARHSVFWPGISHEIIELVSHCSECLTHCNRQQQETLLQHDIPDTP